jgi:hypothetical protein
MATKTLEENLTFPGVTKEVRAEVDNIAALVAATKAAKTAEEKAKKALKEDFLKPGFFEDNHGARIPTLIYDIAGRKNVAQIDFINKYRVDEDRFDQLETLLGEALAGKFFQKTYKITIDPNTTSGMDKVNFLQELKELCEEYAVGVEIEDQFVAKEEFHTGRHFTFTPETNQAIDEIVPMEIQITF